MSDIFSLTIKNYYNESNKIVGCFFVLNSNYIIQSFVFFSMDLAILKISEEILMKHTLYYVHFVQHIVYFGTACVTHAHN